MQYLDSISKATELSMFIFWANYSISVIQVYAPATNAKEAEFEWFYEDLQDLLELIPKIDVLSSTPHLEVLGSCTVEALLGEF